MVLTFIISFIRKPPYAPSRHDAYPLDRRYNYAQRNWRIRKTSKHELKNLLPPNTSQNATELFKKFPVPITSSGGTHIFSWGASNSPDMFQVFQWESRPLRWPIQLQNMWNDFNKVQCLEISWPWTSRWEILPLYIQKLTKILENYGCSHSEPYEYGTRSSTRQVDLEEDKYSSSNRLPCDDKVVHFGENSEGILTVPGPDPELNSMAGFDSSSDVLFNIPHYQTLQYITFSPWIIPGPESKMYRPVSFSHLPAPRSCTNKINRKSERRIFHLNLTRQVFIL